MKIKTLKQNYTCTLDTNVVDLVISDDNFEVPSVSKKAITNDVTIVLMTVDRVSLVADTTVLAKDANVTIVVKAVGIWTSFIPVKMSCVLSSKETVALIVGSDFRQVLM